MLDISSNQISQLTDLRHLEHLEELWASSNRLSSFDEIEKQLANKKELNTVYFEGNPLQTKNPALYRNKVRLAIPQITQIDASTFPNTQLCDAIYSRLVHSIRACGVSKHRRYLRDLECLDIVMSRQGSGKQHVGQ